jgi:hypothetical protein
VNALASNPESTRDIGGTARFVEIPAHPERGGRKQFNPVNVAELRPEISIRFNDRVVSRSDPTLVVGRSGFSHQALGLQLVQYLIEVGLRILSLTCEFRRSCCPTSTQCVQYSKSGLGEHRCKLYYSVV